MGTCLADQFAHFGMTCLIVRSLDEDQARLAFGGRKVELPLSGGYPFGILCSIFISEKPDVYITLLDLLKIHIVSLAITGRDVLEEKHFEVSSEQCVTLDKCL